jgi:MoxR-like ATPase
MDILERYSAPVTPLSQLKPTCSAEDILQMQAAVGDIYCSREVRSYVANIAAGTRRHSALQLGVSTRGAIALIKAAQAEALLAGRDFIMPEDVQKMMLPVLTHRVMLSPEARMKAVTADRVLSSLLETVQVPVRLP